MIDGTKYMDELTKMPQFVALDSTTARDLKAWIAHPSGDFAKAVEPFYPGMSTADRYLLGTPLFHNANAMAVVDEYHHLDAIRRRAA